MRLWPMKRFWLICFLILFLWIGSGVNLCQTDEALQSEVEVCFSPEGSCAERIISQIKKARNFIQVAMYYFTSKEIALALLEARNRGVEIEVLLDSSQDNLDYSQAKFLKNRGIPVRFYSGKGKMHQKFCIIDDQLVFSGSFNWTEAADKKNVEDLLEIRDGEIVRIYKERFWQLWKKGNLMGD